MNSDLLKKKEEILNEVKLYFPDLYDAVKNNLDMITEEEKLKEELGKIETQINDRKNMFSDSYYSDEKGNTYYANIEEDNKIYNPEKEEDAKIVDEALKSATKDYLDVEPTTINDEKKYRNLKRFSLTYSEELGYGAKEDENGIFHGILKETTFYLYPDKNIELNETNLKILNSLFRSKDGSPLTENSEINFENVYPAEIFVPYLGVVDDPINNLTYGEVLIGEGVKVDPTFKDSKVKDITIPKPKGWVNKGVLEKQEKIIDEIKTEDTIKVVGYKEDIILEPKKFTDSTFIPAPRDKKEDESTLDYEIYLKEHAKKYGLENKVEPKILEHSDEKKEDKAESKEKNYEEIYGLKAFLQSAYKIETLKGYEPYLKIAYIKAYKNYLQEVLITKPETKIFVESTINQMNENIEKINNGKIL